MRRLAAVAASALLVSGCAGSDGSGSDEVLTVFAASSLTAGFHICTEGRPQFYALCDGLPQYPHDAPGIVIA